MSILSRVAVIGGGNGALAAAAHLTTAGFAVSLCDPYDGGRMIQPLAADRKVYFKGVLGDGSVTVDCITSDVAEAVPGADLVLVCVPATAHGAVARALAPVLPPGATVLLDPGHSGGALHFRRELQDSGFAGDLVLGETNTLTYIARKADERTVNITSISRHIHVSALPAARLAQLLAKTSAVYPELIPTPTVLGTTLRNMNAMMHPAGMILGAAWIEATGGDFTFYYDGATRAVARLMQAIDDERLAVAAAWGEPMEPIIDLLAAAAITTESARQSRDLLRAFRESEPDRWIKAPPSLDHRYMHEDFGCGLVPMAALGRAVGAPTPAMDSLIRVASVINDIDYWQTGLNLERLGLAGLSADQVRAQL